MALKPDNLYEYRACISCGKLKKVYCDNEPLLDWTEWIKDNNHLSDPVYKGLCMICTREELDFRVKKRKYNFDL
jgi:hypothetical protein